MHSTTLWKCFIFYRGKNLPAAIVSSLYKEDLSIENNKRGFPFHLAQSLCFTMFNFSSHRSMANNTPRSDRTIWRLLLTLTNTLSNGDRAITWSCQCGSQWSPIFVGTVAKKIIRELLKLPKRTLRGINTVSGGHISRRCLSCCLFCVSVGGRCGTLPCLFFHPFKWSHRIDGMTSRAKPAAQCKGHAAHWSRGPLIDPPCIMGLRTRSLTHTEP